MAEANVTNGVNGMHLSDKPDYDVVAIGAGFAGIRMIPELRKLNLSFRMYEAGSGVGGTWYWNRYPGARTDSESWVYILNISPEVNQEWSWKERFPRQPEVLEYLNFVADKFDMKKDITFNTRVTIARWDEAKNLWRFETDQGEKVTAKYFVSCTGVLSVGRELPFKNYEKFKGETYKSFAWPKHKVDFKGKKIAVVGTGATAVQIIPVVAHEAGSLTVFQRTANYVLPARNHPVTEEQMRDIKDKYDEVWQTARDQIFGMHFVDSKQEMMKMEDKEKIRRVLENGWEIGGFRYIFETFSDLMTSQEANDIASDFVKEKIRATVHDESTADLLCPTHGLMGKRPPLGHHYFQTFNKPNVKLIDLSDNPIETITETGIKLTGKDKRTGEDEYEFDMIIYATGFDGGTGAVTSMDIRGKDGRSLGEEWHKEVVTYLGITAEGFPNLYMISAPQSPFANLPIVLDNTSTWISNQIEYMEKHTYKTVEPTKEASDKWTKQLTDVYEGTVLPAAATKAGSWYIGANVPGKRQAPLFWFGGAPSYFQICNAEAEASYPSMVMA